MNTKILLLTTSILFLACNTTRHFTQADTDIISAAQNLTFEVYYSMHDIPKDLSRSYNQHYKEGMSMSDKDGQFNPYDVGEKNIPSKRFIFGASAELSACRLFVFEEGGIGLKNYCIISRKEKDGEFIQRVYLFRRANDIDQLKEIIANKEYRVFNKN